MSVSFYVQNIYNMSKCWNGIADIIRPKFKNYYLINFQNWSWGYKTFTYSTKLSTKFFLLINVKMPTIIGILTFISMINTTSERLKARNFLICRYFSFNEQLKFRAQLSWALKKFYNLGAWSWGYKTFTYSTEHGLWTTHKILKIVKNNYFFALLLSVLVFIMVIHVKMPVLVGILILTSMITFILSFVEHEKSCITSMPVFV